MHSCWTYWGHSGGPLLDATGCIVGLHSSWDDETGTRHGIHLDALTEFVAWQCLNGEASLNNSTTAALHRTAYLFGHQRHRCHLPPPWLLSPTHCPDCHGSGGIADAWTLAADADRVVSLRDHSTVRVYQGLYLIVPYGYTFNWTYLIHLITLYFYNSIDTLLLLLLILYKYITHTVVKETLHHPESRLPKFKVKLTKRSTWI